MNTVFVLMAVTSHFWVSPTIEFSSESKCVVALAEIKKAAASHQDRFSGYCVRIEK